MIIDIGFVLKMIVIVVEKMMMGIVDIIILNEIYQEAIRLNKQYQWGFHFMEDTGAFETAIEFIEPFSKPGTIEVYCPPIAKNWSDAGKILCPDILDFENKIIIEYEESTGQRRLGARLARKGHGYPGDLINKRDSLRDEYYQAAGFRVCKIWENPEFKMNTWKKKLFHFLADCYCKRDVSNYSCDPVDEVTSITYHQQRNH